MRNLELRSGILLALAENGISPSDLGRYCLEKMAAATASDPLKVMDNIAKDSVSPAKKKLKFLAKAAEDSKGKVDPDWTCPKCDEKLGTKPCGKSGEHHYHIWCIPKAEKKSDAPPIIAAPDIQIDPLKGISNALSSAGDILVGLPAAALIGIAGATGIGGGYLAHTLTQGSYKDQMKDLKDQQLIRELRLQSDNIKRRLKLKQLQNQASL